MTNWSNNVLYIGVTNDLERRCKEHNGGLNNGFTSKYNVHKLVYFEEHEHIEDAIKREKNLKGLLRIKKIQLIEAFNKEWEDLFPGKLRLPAKRNSQKI
jgi:putative endonuclease